MNKRKFDLTYKLVEDIIQEVAEHRKYNELLSPFTAVYMPLADKLSKGEQNEHEERFLVALMFFYLSEIEGYKDSVEIVLKAFLDGEIEALESPDLKEGVSCIVHKKDYENGVHILLSYAEKIFK